VLVTVRAVLADGRRVEFTRNVEGRESLSPEQVLEREAHDGALALSDSETIPLGSITHAEFVERDTPAGPGWGPGLQDEDAAAAAASDFRGDEESA
jgi:hypothetical protein